MLVPLTVRQIHSMQNLQAHAPRTASFLRAHYRQTFVSGEARVWLRADRRRRTHVGRFRLSFELDDDQIVRIRVAMDEATR